MNKFNRRAYLSLMAASGAMLPTLAPVSSTSQNQRDRPNINFVHTRSAEMITDIKRITQKG